MRSRDRICLVCGQQFYDRQATSIRQKYCSSKCHGVATSARAAKSYPPKAEVQALYNSGMSDREIAQHYRRSYQWALLVRRYHGIAGRANGSWNRKPISKQNDRARWGIHRKPEKACRNCGRSGRLDLHHAVPRSLCRASKYDLRNGLPLCDRCHVGWHRKLIVISRAVFTPEEWAYLTNLKLVDREIGAWLDKHYPKVARNG